MKKSSCILSLYSCCSNNACLNTKLMYTKKIFQAIILSMVALCLGCSKSNIKTTLEYVQCAKNAVEDNKYVSIKLTKHSLFNDIEDPTEVFYIIYCYDKKNPSFTVINSDSTKTMIFDKENYFLIDHNTREIACINKCNSNGKKAYWNMKNHAKGYLREMPYYHQLLEKDLYSGNQLIHKSVTDTFIDGKKTKVFASLTPIGYIYNNTTSKYDIPIQYSVYSYVNVHNYHIDSVFIKNITNNDFELKTTYIISDISFEDKQSFFESVLDFSKSIYYDYSFHDEDNLPYSMRGSTNDTINNAIKNYPLVSIHGDTTYIKDKNSWILLNLWCKDCPSCIETLLNYKNEIDSLGYRILEKEGIEILAINYKTDNIALLENIAKKTSSKDIMFSAKGFNTCISIPYLGYYYLITPDKNIVYKDHNLGDYSKLLNAKKGYEK